MTAQVRLSPRERDIHEHLVGSLEPIKIIAEKLSVCEGTAKIYASRLYAKLGCTHGRIELMHREIVRLKRRYAEEFVTFTGAD